MSRRPRGDAAAAPNDDPLVSTSVRLPASMIERLERAAAIWRVDRTAIIRRAIEDGMESWTRPEIGDDLKARLELIERCAVASLAMLNVELEAKMSLDWKRSFEAKKAAVRAAGGAER